MNPADLQEANIIQIDLNPPLATIAASDGLTTLLDRVEKFITLPDTATKAVRDAKRKRAIEEVSKALVVTNDDQFQVVGAYVAECSAIAKAITKRWEPVKNAAHRAHKLACEMEANELAAKSIIREAGDMVINAYRVEQRRLQQEREREEQEQRDRESRALREAAEAEERRQAELERQAAAARAEGDIKTAKAIAAEAAKVSEKVEDLSQQAEIVQNEIPTHEPAAKIEGRVERWPWVGECTDPEALIKAVAEGKFPLSHDVPERGGGTKRVPILQVNQEVINYYAKRLEGNAVVPGCKFEKKLQSAYR